MKFLEGKKTYIGAGLILVVAALAFWYGADAFGMVAVGLGLGLVGLGHKSDRLARDMRVGIASLHKLTARQPLSDAEKAQLIAAGFDAFQELSAPIAPSGGPVSSEQAREMMAAINRESRTAGGGQ